MQGKARHSFIFTDQNHALMKFSLKLSVFALLAITVFGMSSCGSDPIEHGIEYTLRVADGSDSVAASKSYLVIANRLKNFEIDGQYYVDMKGNDIIVRIAEGATYDPSRLKKLLESSAELTFRVTYNMGEIGDELNQAHQTYLRMNKFDSATAAVTPFLGYLTPQATPDGLTPFIGYCYEKDTAMVGAILRTDSIAVLFPFDLVFHWGKGMTDENGQPTLVLVACKTGSNYEMSGEHIASAEKQFDSQSGSASPQISITFDQTGTTEWSKMTKANVGRSLAIELADFVYSAPTVQAEITGGQAVITGNFTETEAMELALMLNSGDLPADFRIVEEKTF